MHAIALIFLCLVSLVFPENATESDDVDRQDASADAQPASAPPEKPPDSGQNRHGNATLEEEQSTQNATNLFQIYKQLKNIREWMVRL